MRRVSGAASRAFALGALALGLVLAPPASGEPYAVGSRIEPLTLTDQHGVERRVDAATRVVLLSRDMDGGGCVREALASEGAALSRVSSWSARVGGPAHPSLPTTRRH
jgi:hypothetical protein